MLSVSKRNPADKPIIGKVLNLEAKERLTGTIAATVYAIMRGANVLRVHDVKETKEAIEIASSIFNKTYGDN